MNIDKFEKLSRLRREIVELEHEIRCIKGFLETESGDLLITTRIAPLCNVVNLDGPSSNLIRMSLNNIIDSKEDLLNVLKKEFEKS